MIDAVAREAEDYAQIALLDQTIRITLPVTPELRAVIERTPHIAPAFLLNTRSKPYAAESIGNLFRDAANKVGMVAHLHGFRKAFCIYWAEKGVTTHQLAAMAGHMTLGEVERYTRAADRRKMVKLLVEKQ